MEEINKKEVIEESNTTEDVPHEKNVRLMSPTRMVIRRFFRSKLSIVGLIMVVSLFLFSFVGPLVYTQWGRNRTRRKRKNRIFCFRNYIHSGGGRIYNSSNNRKITKR